MQSIPKQVDSVLLHKGRPDQVGILFEVGYLLTLHGLREQEFFYLFQHALPGMPAYTLAGQPLPGLREKIIPAQGVHHAEYVAKLEVQTDLPPIDHHMIRELVLQSHFARFCARVIFFARRFSKYCPQTVTTHPGSPP